MRYTDDDMLMLSGIQHFVFCPRQWTFIHIEQVWNDNALTAEGKILHKNVDCPDYRQLNNGVITIRSMHISSFSLGLYGICDAIELIPTPCSDNTISHSHYPGRYIPYPVEYKRGHAKSDECDIIQLVAQVMCLEEMYNISIEEAALFYWEIRRREKVLITNELREHVQYYADEMHHMYTSGLLPTV